MREAESMHSGDEDWPDASGVQGGAGGPGPRALDTDVLVPRLTCRQLLMMAPPLAPWPEDLVRVLEKAPKALVSDAIAEWVYDPASGLGERLWRIARHHLRHFDPDDARSIVEDAVLDLISHIQQIKPVRTNLQ